MPRREFITETEDTFDPGPLPEIDKTRKTALYIRQSGKKADTKHGESRETQLKLKDFAMHLRGDTNLSGVEVYDEKAGKSGTLDTHERPELLRLWNDIALGLIAVVIVARLDRLYRDDIGDQYGAFIRHAMKHNVIVIVPAIKEGQQHKFYDLNNRDHRKAFRDEMEKAGSYIPENIAYLHKCKAQKAARGCYDGRSLPPGLAIDKSHDKSIRRPVIYEPWAEIMREIWQRAKELHWNFNLLTRELHAKPYIFPDIPEDNRARYIFSFRMTKVKGGYKATSANIRNWFKCLALAGHWETHDKEKGIVQTRLHNHPAVIDPALFEEGYIQATGEDLQGNITLENKRAPKERSIREGEINLVLRHIMTCPQADFISNSKRKAKDEEGNEWIEDDYIAVKWAFDDNPTRIFTLNGPELDAIVRDRLIEWTEADNTLADKIKAEFYKVHQEQIQNLSSVKAALDEAELQREKIEGRMAKAVTDTLYNKLEGELIVCCAKIAKLQADINTIEKIKGTEEIDEYYDILKYVRKRYGKMSLQKKQILWQILTESVTVEALSPHWVRLVINWIIPITPFPDVAYIWRKEGTKAYDFTPEELALLKEEYPKAKRYSDILPLFPNRTFAALSVKARTVFFAGNQCNIKRVADLPIGLSWNDLLAISDRETSLAMAKEAIEACKPTEENKQGKFLYALWWSPVDIAEWDENELGQMIPKDGSRQPAPPSLAARTHWSLQDDYNTN